MENITTKELLAILGVMFSYSASALGGVYPKIEDPVRNSVTMLATTRYDQDRKGYTGGMCSGILLTTKNGYPLLITSAHCLIPGLKAQENGETSAISDGDINFKPTSTIAYVPRYPGEDELINPSFGNQRASCEMTHNRFDLRNCKIDNTTGFRPSNNMVIAVAALSPQFSGDFHLARTDNASANYIYIPPRVNNNRPDFVVIPLSYLNDGSTRPSVDFGNVSEVRLPQASELPPDHSNSFLYGWGFYYEHVDSDPVYGKLSTVMVNPDYNSNSKTVYKVRPAAKFPVANFLKPSDSGAPIISYVTQGGKFSHLELRGIISMGYRLDHRADSTNYAADIRPYSDWIQVILDNDGDYNKIVDDSRLSATMKNFTACKFGTYCIFRW